MAISMKLKFAGLLRGLLRHIDDSDFQSSRRIAASAPPPAAAAPAPVVGHNLSPAPRTASANEIELPLAPIIAALPMDLRAKLMSVPPAGMTIRLSVETAMSQLAFGAVKISFGELRALAPGIFANTGADHDHRPVSLPLSEVLSRLNPALLARRPVQKVEVHEEIAGPFGGEAHGITFTTQPLKPAPAAPSPPPPAAPPMNIPVRPIEPVAFRPMTPPPHLTAPVPPRPAAPPAAPIAFPPRSMTPSASQAPLPTPSIPVRPVSVGNVSDIRPAASPPLAMKAPTPTPATPPIPIPAAVAARPEPPQPAQPAAMIFATLGELSESWPEELKYEIARALLAGDRVPLAGNAVEAGLKRGRVTATWKQLRTLARPGSPASANDNLELELPLKVIAPLFLAAQKARQKPQAKVSVSAEIPDLFFGFPQPTPAPVAPTPPPVPPTASPVQLPTMPPERKTSDTNLYTRDTSEAPKTVANEFERPTAVTQTDFTHRHAHPQDVVTRALAVAGVAGAVVSLPDGLRVASQVPDGLNADALAAFLPQIFERVNQTTRELRMGALNNVSFTVGNVPWKIFRVSSVYFAAFGHAGQPLPTAQLAQLAVELDRKKPQ